MGHLYQVTCSKCAEIVDVYAPNPEILMEWVWLEDSCKCIECGGSFTYKEILANDGEE